MLTKLRGWWLYRRYRLWIAAQRRANLLVVYGEDVPRHILDWVDHHRCAAFHAYDDHRWSQQ